MYSSALVYAFMTALASLRNGHHDYSHAHSHLLSSVPNVAEIGPRKRENSANKTPNGAACDNLSASSAPHDWT